MQVVYLGISGTLHPSQSTYELVHQRSPWADGHAPYEAVPWLAKALAPWPDARIVLTSTQARAKGTAAVLKSLGQDLASRVIGFTYEDLTTKVVRQVLTRSGTTKQISYSSADYWRMNKSDIVIAHVDWLGPRTWVAVDDEDILWPRGMADHVCIVDGCKGLKHPVEQDKLLTYLQVKFGLVGKN